jgi:hypothetical protein
MASLCAGKTLKNNSIMIHSLFCLRFDDGYYVGLYEGHCIMYCVNHFYNMFWLEFKDSGIRNQELPPPVAALG